MPTEASPPPDFILPFLLDVSHLRGRVVRLGPALDAILGRHDYPEAVAKLLAEAITLAALLSHMLKFEGVFTFQVKGDSAINTLVADVTTQGYLRGYATFDRAGVERLAGEPEMALFGKGYIAFTVDQGEAVERYQGIVELRGETLADAVQHYFRQSEQIQTALLLATKQLNGHWQSTGLMLQKLPDPREATGTADEDDWRRTMILMSSSTEEEMLDPSLASERLLYRLFHEESLRLFERQPLRDQCRCSSDRVERVLKSLPEAELETLHENGLLHVTCEFCARRYEFGLAQFLKKAATKEARSPKARDPKTSGTPKSKS